MKDHKISENKLLEFLKSLEPLCKNTGKNSTPSFGDELSYLSPSTDSREIQNYNFLCLDIGGTRCKACIKRKLSGNQPEWSEVLDLDNNELNTGSAGKGLELMSQELARRIKQSLLSLNIPTDFDGIAIVWSNKLQNFILESGGIGAKVYGSQDGQAYRKGEWWNRDIMDGDDLSAYFISGFKAADISFKSLVINNDTVFTAKALKGAAAGVVASTGANTTIVAPAFSRHEPAESRRYMFFNAECGGKICITEDLLNLQKVPARLPASGIQVKIEDVCAGKGLPQIVHLHINEEIAIGNEFLETLDLKNKPFSAPEISKMLDSGSTESLLSRGLTDSGQQSAVIGLIKDIIHNAGAFCAVLLLVSVINQISDKKELLVALDSSQARFMPGYKESLDKYLGFFNQHFGSKISYQLLEPQGKISVPLQGAANTLEDFYI